MKKFFAILLALALVMSMGSTVFADDSTTSTISTTDDHTYEVYQIFTGDLAADGKTLSNVKWGENAKLPSGVKINDPVSEDVLAALLKVTDSTDNQAKLAVIEKYVDFNTEAIATVTKDKSASVPNGYYLIKDLGVSDGKGGYSVPAGEEYSEYITKIVENVIISPKKDETTTEKKVDDKNDTTGAEDETVWQDSADYDIGDEVPFRLTATITDTYDNFQTYYFAFHDTQSAGLTFNDDSVEVFVDGNKITSGYEITKDTSKGETFQIVFANLKSIEYTIPATTEDGEATTGTVHAGSVITVTYTSTLNSGAAIGSEGNPNTMYGEYFNNPNSDGKGTTTPDTVIVFTYELEADKVTNNPKFNAEEEAGEDNPEYIPLTGAGFTLYKQTGSSTWTKIGDEVKGEAMTSFVWKGIDDGTYKLVETTTPDGYNTMDDLVFTVTASHDTESAAPALTELACTEDGFTVETDKTEGTAYTGRIYGDIINNAGTILPETGGIGTTIFYVTGSILLIGAAVLLITRKRMHA